jgi:hypothetical protein
MGIQQKLHTKLVQKLILTPSLQQAIKQAQPLPPWPEGIADRTLDITLNFRDSS